MGACQEWELRVEADVSSRIVERLQLVQINPLRVSNDEKVKGSENQSVQREAFHDS
jgi:hypothetical protein